MAKRAFSTAASRRAFPRPLLRDGAPPPRQRGEPLPPRLPDGLFLRLLLRVDASFPRQSELSPLRPSDGLVPRPLLRDGAPPPSRRGEPLPPQLPDGPFLPLSLRVDASFPRQSGLSPPRPPAGLFPRPLLPDG